MKNELRNLIESVMIKIGDLEYKFFKNLILNNITMSYFLETYLSNYIIILEDTELGDFRDKLFSPDIGGINLYIRRVSNYDDNTWIEEFIFIPKNKSLSYQKELIEVFFKIQLGKVLDIDKSNIVINWEYFILNFKD